MRGLQCIVLAGILAAGSACLAEEATSPAVSVAEEEELEHGKLNTGDATPVEPGHVELEFGYSYTRAERSWDSDGNSQSRGLFHEHAPGVSLTVGALKNLDFNLSVGYLWLHDGDGDPTRGDSIGDTSIGGRYRFLNIEEQNLEVAYTCGFTMPTGSRTSATCLGTSQEFWSWDNALALTKDWGRWTWNADVGYSLPLGEERDDARGTLTANLAAGYQLLHWLQPEVELNYAQDLINAGDDCESLAVTGGLVMPINERLGVNVGVQRGVWGRNSDQATSLILSVKLAS